jgi:hypothetical protein
MLYLLTSTKTKDDKLKILNDIKAIFQIQYSLANLPNINSKIDQ